MMKTILTVF